MSLQRGGSSSPANGPNFENAQRANREILEINLAGLKIPPVRFFRDRCKNAEPYDS
jgi:hypothetical protein